MYTLKAVKPLVGPDTGYGRAHDVVPAGGRRGQGNWRGPILHFSNDNGWADLERREYEIQCAMAR